MCSQECRNELAGGCYACDGAPGTGNSAKVRWRVQNAETDHRAFRHSQNSMPTDPVDFDYIVIGSGFGGSVSALRLAEKGYSVAVVERGKRWGNEDFPKTNWNVPKFLWMPKLLCFGIQALTLLRDTMILHGCGVGGGSLVYANTLLVPPDEVFNDSRWRSLADWKADLAQHYETAKQMMGVTTARCQAETDHLLREVAQDMGREETYHPTEVAVFFGDPGKTVPDPYFGGIGPDRAGCTLCGGCMVGCRHNAKNTLDKNYLFFAEQRGVQIIPETEVRNIRESSGGGYEIDTVCITDLLFKRRQTIRCRGIVAAAGVLGTVPLLMKCKVRGSLPRISNQLGRFVRTNSEGLWAARAVDRMSIFRKASRLLPASGQMTKQRSKSADTHRGRTSCRCSARCWFRAEAGPVGYGSLPKSCAIHWFS